jgi:hypothetical protein
MKYLLEKILCVATLKHLSLQDQVTTNPTPQRDMLTFNLCGHDFSPYYTSTQSRLNSRVEKCVVRRGKSYILEATEDTTQMLETKVCLALPQ